MMRINAFSCDCSLLYHKLPWIDGLHSVKYANVMPMGTLQRLTSGHLEYVRRWIEAGAPRAGHVADTVLLRDIHVQTATFSPLAVPTLVDIQQEVDNFTVFSVGESELFVSWNVGKTTDC